MFGWASSLVSSAVGAVSGLFGGGSSSGNSGGGNNSSSSETYHNSKTTNYDPDKVRVAELENDRVGLVKEAQIELLQINAQLEAAMIEARCRGFHHMQQAMMGMLKEVNVLAEERLVLLEEGSLQQIQQVEDLYADLKTDVQHDDFLVVKVPQMLNLANQFPEESDTRKTFMNGIDQEMATHFNFKTNQLNKLNERCHIVVASVVASKERMQQHIDHVITKRIEHIEHVMHSNAQLVFKGATLQLDPPKQSGGNELDKIEHQIN